MKSSCMWNIDIDVWRDVTDSSLVHRARRVDFHLFQSASHAIQSPRLWRYHRRIFLFCMRTHPMQITTCRSCLLVFDWHIRGATYDHRKCTHLSCDCRLEPLGWLLFLHDVQYCSTQSLCIARLGDVFTFKLDMYKQHNVMFGLSAGGSQQAMNSGLWIVFLDVSCLRACMHERFSSHYPWVQYL